MKFQQDFKNQATDQTLDEKFFSESVFDIVFLQWVRYGPIF